MKSLRFNHVFGFLGVILVAIILISRTPVYASDTGVVSATVTLAICGDNIKNSGEQCDGSDLAGKSCSYLGYSGGTLGCSPSCQYDVSACTADASDFAHTTLAPDASRTYVLPSGSDSVGIYLPEAFYTSDLSLYLFSHVSAPVVPSGQSLVGKLYNLIFVNDNGDTTHSLLKATTLTLSYADSDVASVDETTLAPYRSEDGGTTWTSIPDFTRNQTAKTVTFTTSDFSIFSIFGSPKTTTTTPPPGGTPVSYSGGFGGVTTLPKATPEERKMIVKIADFNGDGVVDIADLSILLFYFQKQGWQVSRYDLNNDDSVDIVDISIMLYYWAVTS